MYNKYFGLNEQPFSIAPDPHYLYMSEQHREALAHLLYGFNSDGGFVLLTGEIGTGKTTVCRCFLDHISENSTVAFIINPKLTVEELLATICDEFGIQYWEHNKSIKVFIHLINIFLIDVHAKGQKAVLIIDEAQNLSTDVLEQLRLLTNLETNRCKLLQIFLLGQPELRDKLSKPELRQLSQRIIARYHLGPLSRNDIGSYVAHRLSVAGLRKQIFTNSSIKKLYHLSSGIPRLINILCDRALLGAFARGKNEVNKSILQKAAHEVFGKNKKQGLPKRAYSRVVSILHTLLSAFTRRKNKPKTDRSVLGKNKKQGLHRRAYSRVVSIIHAFLGAFTQGKNKLIAACEVFGKYINRGLSGKTCLRAASILILALAGAVLAAAYYTKKPIQTLIVNTKEPDVSQEQVIIETSQPDTLQWTDDPSENSDRELAFKELFRKWKLSYQSETDVSACDQALEQGLHCFYGWGGLNNFIRLNRPAVLMLSGDQGKKFYVTLTSINSDKAVITSGQETRTVPLIEIASRWLGSYMLLWRAPPGYQGVMLRDIQDPVIPWLETILASIQGREPSPGNSTILDTELMNHIKKFQVDKGLVPNGLAGPQTFIHINNVINNDAPKLVDTQKDT